MIPDVVRLTLMSPDVPDEAYLSPVLMSPDVPDEAYHRDIHRHVECLVAHLQWFPEKYQAKQKHQTVIVYIGPTDDL